MKKFLPETIVICAIVMVVTYGFAQTWTQTGSGNSYYNSIAESADGRVILAVGSTSVVRSTNFGVTWDSINSWSLDARSSADGTKWIRILENGATYISTNSGTTWNTSLLGNGRLCASSTDGSKLIAVGYNGFSYTSTNSGTTWLTNNAPTNNGMLLTSSADGTRLALAARNGKIYTSINSGLSWVTTSAPSNNWSGIASSVDGNQLVASSIKGIYISTNSGGSWASNGIIAFSGVASSANGSKLVACNTNGQIYISTNYGASWISNNIVGNKWNGVASSADGKRLFAADVFAGHVWTYQADPSPKLNAAPSNNNVALSWLVPSTNFVYSRTWI